MTRCLFCGGDRDEPNHLAHCDGRQGALEDALEALQDAIDDPLRARTSDPDTSHASMAALDRDTMRTAMDVAVAVHRAHGPLADFEFAPLFAAAWARPCCDHLYRQARSVARDHGLLRDSGARRVNPVTGRRQVVWAASDGGDAPIIRCCPTCGHVLRRELEATP